MLIVDELLAQARAETGLAAFGDMYFLEPLSVLVRSLNDEAGLSQSGEAILRARIVEQLKARLRIERYFHEEPAIADEVIEAPAVILGLPRTGTTFLQRVMSADRRFYSLLWWEARFPAPFGAPGEAVLDGAAEDPRIAVAKDEVAAIIAANPGILAIHPLDATLADEEGLLLEMTFCSFYDAYADLPGYGVWLRNSDLSAAYFDLRRMLQFLQWQKRQRGEIAGPWLLKTPNHLRQLGALFAAFPDARLIQTHRDPLKTIPSIVSFNHELRKFYMQAPDPRRTGAEVANLWADALAGTGVPGGQAYDLPYDQLVADPMVALEGIYRFLGMDIPADTRAALAAAIAANRRERRASHDYALENFGLSEASIAEAFKPYRQRHGFGAGG